MLLPFFYSLPSMSGRRADLCVMRVEELAMSVTSCNTQERVGPASHLASRVELALEAVVTGEPAPWTCE